MGSVRRVAVGLLIAALAAALILVALVAVYTYTKTPLPAADQCVARVQQASVPLDVEQSRNSSIIAGVATQRGLVPRATTIALATAYQESGLRNLDYGDRDSLGLFQQRPSQGWGTAAQVQDPWYASNRFFEELVKVDNWRTGNVNDVAQAVQRSGHPNGYARHVENARRLASALSGETPASFTCVVKDPPLADPAGMDAFLRATLPADSQVTLSPGRVTVRARTNQLAWSAAHIALANTAAYGVARVEVGGQHWTASRTSLAPWLGEKTNATTAVILFELPSPTPTR